MNTRDRILQDGACTVLLIAARRRGLAGLEQAYNRLSDRQRQLVPAAFLDELRAECASTSVQRRTEVPEVSNKVTKFAPELILNEHEFGPELCIQNTKFAPELFSNAEKFAPELFAPCEKFEAVEMSTDVDKAEAPELYDIVTEFEAGTDCSVRTENCVDVHTNGHDGRSNLKET